MKEKLIFFGKAEYLQFDWWIKYSQNQLKYQLLNKTHVSRKRIIKSIFRLNILLQLNLFTIYFGILFLSGYACVKSSFLLWDFINGLLVLPFEQIILHFKLFLLILSGVSISFIALLYLVANFPDIDSFQEVNGRIKRLMTCEIPIILNNEHIIESLNKKNFDITNPDDIESIIIRMNIEEHKEQDNYTIKDEDALDKLLEMGKNKFTGKNQNFILCAIAHRYEIIEFPEHITQVKRINIWLKLMNSKKKYYGDSLINNPFYQRTFNSKKLKDRINPIIAHINEVGLKDIAKELKKDLITVIIKKDHNIYSKKKI